MQFLESGKLKIQWSASISLTYNIIQADDRSAHLVKQMSGFCSHVAQRSHTFDDSMQMAIAPPITAIASIGGYFQVVTRHTQVLRFLSSDRRQLGFLVLLLCLKTNVNGA